jgi:Protein of unknown function (DUF1565).
MIYFVSTTGSDSNLGTIDAPWRTVETAVNKVAAGDILYIRGGEYVLAEAVICKMSGTADKGIVYSAYEGETPVLNAENINFFLEKDKYNFGVETGAIFVYQQEYIQVRGITVKNSHGHGIAVRDSNNVIVDSCTTDNTFCPGISLWDTKWTGVVCHHNKILNNTVIKATTWDMLPEGRQRGNEPPHEAISVAGACDFEVAFNHVYNCDKEGIDVKEVSHHGTVHHNHVHHVDRQGLYADAWFGPLTNVDFYENDVHDCKGAGIVVSVEQGHNVSFVKIYNNNVYDNYGTGILFGIFGADKIRFNIDVFNNIVRHNGHGHPGSEKYYFWITGGLCLLSANATDCKIYNNIFIDNKGFDIGYSDRWCPNGESIDDAFKAKRIEIFDNVIIKNPDAPTPTYPITTTYENSVMYPYEK